MKDHQIPQQTAPANFEPVIRNFVRKLLLTLTIKHALTLITIWCFAWGTVALVLRATGITNRKGLLWGAVGIGLAFIAAAVAARSHLPSRREIEALLDERNHCGGLLMATSDAEIGVWRQRMPELTLPRLRWQNSRSWALFAAAAAFVVISLIVPMRWAGTNTVRPLDVSQEAEKLSAQIEVMKEAQIIEKPKAEELEKKLDQLVAEARGEDPAKTWEALDHLSDTIEKTTKDAVESANAEQNRMDRAEALAEGLMAGSDQLDAKTMTEAIETLSAMMQSAMKENEMLASNLSSETRGAIESGALKPEHLQEISKALEQNKSAISQNLQKLAKSGMINPNALKGGARGNRRDNSDLAKFLKENAQEMSIEDAVGAWCENPGKGGVTRGRGDAEMTWTDGTSEKDAKFKEQVLPPSSVAGLDESQLVGMSASAPTPDKTAIAAHGALNNIQAGSGSAYTQSILPRHKGTVKRYFDRSR